MRDSDTLPAEDDWMTRAEVCQMLGGIHRRTLKRWEDAGIAPTHFKINGRARYRRLDVIEFQEQVRVVSGNG